MACLGGGWPDWRDTGPPGYVPALSSQSSRPPCWGQTPAKTDQSKEQHVVQPSGKDRVPSTQWALTGPPSSFSPRPVLQGCQVIFENTIRQPVRRHSQGRTTCWGWAGGRDGSSRARQGPCLVQGWGDSLGSNVPMEGVSSDEEGSESKGEGLRQGTGREVRFCASLWKALPPP